MTVLGPPATGTPESDWSVAGLLDAVAPVDLDAVRRLVVVAPHPDDEVLAVGGLLCRAAQCDVEVVVLAVTDGEASHPGSSAVTPLELSRLRAEESSRAYRDLGLPPSCRHRMGCPDGAGAGLEAPLLAALCEILEPDDLLVAPWEHDGHPDHEAVGRSARRAAAERVIRLLGYPVWAWHWTRPADGVLPWSRAVAVRLTPGERAAKRSAVGRYRSQLEPVGPDPADTAVVPPEVLAHFDRDMEVLLR